MIFKSYEIDKINIKNYSFVLFYGQNEGAKKKEIEKFKKKLNIEKIIKFDEKEILENDQIFYNEILSKSLFEEKKLITINHTTDKLLRILDKIGDKKIDDVIIIINAGLLEKRSKLRSFFEKEKDIASIAFYPDNFETLSKIASNFLINNSIKLSQANINLIISKCKGDREILENELNKILMYSSKNKNLNIEIISKLTNLIENHEISELANNYLAKNSSKTMQILNENNYTNEDCILILRAILNKSKKILLLRYEYEKNKNIDLTISNAKPPIFWKEKNITKLQIEKWKSQNLKEIIYKLSEIELNIKKNINNSIDLVTDFLLTQSISKTSN